MATVPRTNHLNMATPIGIINKNPGNIWNDPNVKFEGETTAPGSNWKQFPSMALGYRALIKNLQAYIKAGNNTPFKITHIWAPAGHGNNNPVRYAENIEKRTGLKMHDPIQVNDVDSLQKLAYSISWSEQGIKPNWGEIYEGARLLGASTPAAMVINAPVEKKNLLPLIVAGTLLTFGIGYVLLRKK